LGFGQVVDGRSTVGGGSLPGETLPTSLLSLSMGSLTRFMEALRRNNPPIIARVEDGRILLDPRTVLLEEEQALLISLKRIWNDNG
jgi:L-seryl-tRNA(Ser) seleniumtransferase